MNIGEVVYELLLSEMLTTDGWKDVTTDGTSSDNNWLYRDNKNLAYCSESMFRNQEIDLVIDQDIQFVKANKFLISKIKL